MTEAWEKLEDLSKRFKLPFIAEYELSFHRRLFYPELGSALAAVEKELGREPSAARYAERGRLRRIMGDCDGAAADLKKALDLDARLARAYLWLGELDLAGPAAEENLTRALGLDKGLAAGYLYRGARRLLAGAAGAAEEDLREFTRLKPRSCLGHILAGLAAERQKKPAARSFRAAASASPVCSAAWLLLSRAEADAAAAARACEKALDADPIYALITLSKYKPGRDWHKHLLWLRAFAFAEPERAGWYYRQEDIHYSPYQLEEYSDSVALSRAFPKAAWALALVARGALRSPPDRTRMEAGTAAIEKAVSLSPRSGWAYAWRGLAWMKAGKLRRAIRDLDVCVRLQPCYHRAYAWRSALLRKVGRVKDALPDMDRALAVDEWYTFIVHERSLARRALGDFVGAAADLDQAFRIDDRYSWVFTVGREPEPREFDAGVSELSRAILTQPRLASLWSWRGQLHLQRRDFPAAFSDLEKALHLDPHHALAHGWYGRALIEDGQPGQAAAYLRRAAELDPAVLVFKGWLAQAESLLGRRKSALALLDSVLAAKPLTWWALHQRARLQLEGGLPRAADADLKKAFKLAGRRVENHFLAARVKLALSDLRGAREAVDKAITISPNLGRAYVLRAQISQREGRHDDAVSDYKVVYRRFPYLLNPEERETVGALLSP